VRLGFYSWWPGRLVSACMTAHAMERVTQPTLAAIPFRAALAYVSSNPRPWDGGLWDSYNKQPAHGAIGRPDRVAVHAGDAANPIGLAR
jgi:hypothetical protein